MSIVVNVLCAHTSWVACDGRASRDGKIVSEAVEKAAMVNRSVCVGYTGALELAKLVMLNLTQHVVGIENMTSDTVVETIKALLPIINAPKDVYCNFLVTGTNRDGLMASYTLGSGIDPCEYIPHGDEVKFSVLHSNKNTLRFEPYIIGHIQKFGFSDASVSNMLRKYIKDVSKIDNSVNSNCLILELQKHHPRTHVMYHP